MPTSVISTNQETAIFPSNENMADSIPTLSNYIIERKTLQQHNHEEFLTFIYLNPQPAPILPAKRPDTSSYCSQITPVDRHQNT